MPIEIKNKTSTTVTEETYELVVAGANVVYKEFLNDKGKIIDVVLRWADNGEDINDPNVLEEIQEYLDEQARLRTEREA